MIEQKDSNEGFVLELRDLGFALKRLPECYQLYQWNEGGGLIRRGPRTGELSEPAWRAVECYPTSFGQALYCIYERAVRSGVKATSMVDAIKQATALSNAVIDAGRTTLGNHAPERPEEAPEPKKRTATKTRTRRR